MSLVELLVAISVLAVVMAATASGLTAALGLNQRSIGRTTAANLAAAQLEIEQVRPFADQLADLDPPAATRVVDGREYTVDVQRVWETISSSGSTCAVGTEPSTPDVLRVSVDVGYRTSIGEDAVQQDTLLFPPAADYDVNNGHVTILVRRIDGQPLDDPVTRYQVTLAGLEPGLPTRMQFLDSGCATFVSVPPGQYRTSITHPGFVGLPFDPTARTFPRTPSRTLTVAAQDVTPTELVYDEAGYLQIPLTAANGGTPLDRLRVSLRAPALEPGGKASFDPPGSAIALPWTERGLEVLPAASGFAVWAGYCESSAPDTPPILTPQPGGDAAVPPGTHLLDTVTPTVLRRNGTPRSDSDLTFRITNLDACGDGESYAGRVRTNALGIAPLAIPAGRWEVSIDSASPQGGAWPQLDVRLDADPDLFVMQLR